MPKPEEDPTPEVVATQPANLDELHAKTMHDLVNGDLPDAPADEEEEVVEDEVEEIEEVEEPPEEVEEPEPTVVPDPPAPDPTPAPELNTDITVKGEGKIAVKNSEGETLYLNNIDELPDDFEPESYKAFAKANAELAQKAIDDRAASRQREIDEQTARNKKEIDDVTSSWDRDIETLTKGGVLPTDEAARDVEVGDVYAYISKKLADGIIIDSFAEAHKAMKYDQIQEEKAKKAKETAALKKEQSSKIMGAGGTNPSKPKVIEPIPSGTTLDDVHRRYAHLK